MGSYGEFAKQSVIVGVFKEDKIIYGISIRRLNTELCLEQFLAACNQPPKEQDKEPILNSLKTRGIFTKSILTIRNVNAAEGNFREEANQNFAADANAVFPF